MFVEFQSRIIWLSIALSLPGGVTAADSGDRRLEPSQTGVAEPLTLVSVLHHEEALSRPHDIEVRGKLAFVAGKGGSVAIVEIGDPQRPRLLWWKNDPHELDDAQTVLPSEHHMFLGARHFFSIDVLEPGQPVFCKKVTDRPRIDRINGMVRRGDFVLTANKNGWVGVFDAGDSADPKLYGALNTRKRGSVNSPHDIALFENHAVVVDQARRTSAHLRLYRIADADTGQLLPVDEWEVAGAIKRDDLTGANRVVVSGGHAFVACSKSNPDNFTLAAIDLSDPNHPRHLITLPFAGKHPTGLTVAGRVLFAAGGRTVQVLDVTDPAEPKTLTVFRSNELFPTGRDNAHDLVHQDGYLYLTAQNDDQIGIVRINDQRILSLTGDNTP